MPQVKNAFMRFRIIDRCLRNEFKPFPSKSELRQVCEEELFGSSIGDHICDSTIEKDIFAMRIEHDAPIAYSKKNDGYYYSDSAYSLDKGPLSAKDVEALRVAAATLSQFKGMSFYQEYGFALDRIINRIQHENHSNNEAEYIQFETGYGESGQKHIPILLKAIQTRKEIWFDYQSFSSDKGKRRKVSPLLLKEYRNNWYLICHDLVKNAIMTFGLDRMENIEVSDQKAILPTQFNTDYYFKHAVGITVTGENPEKVVLSVEPIASKYLQLQKLHASQELINETPQGNTFQLFVLITEELIRSILSYGGEIEVLEPISLRKTIQERTAKLAARYQ